MKTFWSIAVAVLAILSAFFGGRASVSCPAPTLRVDSVLVRDTIRDTIPKPVVKYVHRIETVAVPIERDTIYETVRDTILIPIPIERKEYKTDTYYAIVEGFRPALVHMETFRETLYITKTETFKTKPRWGIGLQAGYGYMFGEKTTMYIGIGVQYNLITW